MNNRKLIYLDDAIIALERKKDKKAKGDIGGFYNKIIQNDIDALMQLPLAQPEQPEQRWIPCSERLPEIDELVLVTDDSGGVKTVDVDRCGQYECSEKRFWYYTQNVVAWMPLPDPWKEGEADG